MEGNALVAVRLLSLPLPRSHQHNPWMRYKRHVVKPADALPTALPVFSSLNRHRAVNETLNSKPMVSQPLPRRRTTGAGPKRN